MKNLIVVTALIVLCSLPMGCKEKDVDNHPILTVCRSTPANNEPYFIEIDGLTGNKLIDPKKNNVIAIGDLSDDIISITDYHSDYEIDGKEFTADKLRKYLNGLSRNKLKYGILMTYIKGGSWESYSETVLKHFCLKNDVDLFTHAPVNRMPMVGELYPNDYAGWVNKSSDSYYAKDEFYNKVYMNGLGETAEDKLPKNVLKITESKTEHYIIDDKKFSAKELEEYLNKLTFADMEDGILLIMNNVKKDEEACFYTLRKFAGAQNVDLFLKKSFVKQDSLKYGKIQHLVRSSRNYIRKMLSKLKVEENLVLSMLTSYKTEAKFSSRGLNNFTYKDDDVELPPNVDPTVNYLYKQLVENKLAVGIDVYRSLGKSVEDVKFPKIVIFSIKNDVNIYLNVEKYLVDEDVNTDDMNEATADFIRKVYLENWYYKAVKPLHSDYDLMNKIYNNGVNEVLLTELPEKILTFTELDTQKYKASDKEYNADDLKIYLKSLDADALKSGILLKTTKTKKSDFPCFLVLEDFCVLNDVKLYIQRPMFDENSPLNKSAFIYSNKIKKQAQELEKTLDPTKNEVLLYKISHKSEYVGISQYGTRFTVDFENKYGYELEELKDHLSKLNFKTERNGIHVQNECHADDSENPVMVFIRDFCKRNDLDLFLCYPKQHDDKKKYENVAIWDIKSSKSPYLDDEYMRKVHENGK